MTFTDHLADQLKVCPGDALAVEHAADRLGQLAQDPLFLTGLRTWVNRLGEAMADADAAQGKEPTAYVLGRRRELRNIPETLARIVTEVAKEFATFNRPETQRHDSAAVSP